MNERIKELAQQATSTVLVNHEGYRGKGYTEQVEFFDKEKFAELIVRECVAIVSDCSVEYCTRPQIVSEIREHFGVEE